MPISFSGRIINLLAALLVLIAFAMLAQRRTGVTGNAVRGAGHATHFTLET